MNDFNRNVVDKLLVEHTAFSRAIGKLNQCFDSAMYSDKPLSLPVVGESRTGKSTVADEFYSDHLPYREPDGLKVPVLKVVAPSEPTVIGLAEHLLFRIGDERFSHGTKVHKTARLKTMIKAAETKMVMIDECQHFVDKATDRLIHSAADWLKTLVDECGVSLVILGLESVLAVLDQNEQLRGRFLAPIEMPRFDWRNKRDRNEFKGIVKAFYSRISDEYDCVDLSSPEMVFRLYAATGGLIGYLWKLLRQATINAGYSRSNIIGLDELHDAYLDAIGERYGPSPFFADFNINVTNKKVEEAIGIGKHLETKTESKRRSKRVKRDSVDRLLRGS